MVGIGTVLHDDPSLTTRLPDNSGRDAIRIILDSNAGIPLTSKVLNLKSDAKTIVAVTENAPDIRIEQLRHCAEVMIVSDNNGKVDMRDLMAKLGKMEITSVLIEGGAEVNASAIKSGVIDKVMFFIAPKIIGGAKAPGPIGGEGISEIAEAYQLREISAASVGEDILITGRL